jgi:hypothetical protein
VTGRSSATRPERGAVGNSPTCGAAACRALPGESSTGAAPHTGQLARTRRPVAQGVTASPMTAPASSDRGRPPRRASSRRAKITVKGAPEGASLTRWRKRHP